MEADDRSPTFAEDLAFLREHLSDLVVLSRGEARVVVAPAYQGRVMTSGVAVDGASFGWIHRARIESGIETPHMNAFGGEDRFWLGPEGGPYALYFPPEVPFEFAHWQVPAPIDTLAWEIVSADEERVAFRHTATFPNRHGTELSIQIDRTVRVLDPWVDAPGARAVAYESVNRITNVGDAAWTADTGLVSVWILSMYRPSPRTTIVIPFRPGPEAELGRVVNADYFGTVPPSRLAIDADAGVIFFRGDGQERGKIGVSHRRARPIMGSWDADAGALTLVTYTLPDEAPTGYVDSMWRDMDEPYAGDVVNSYDDGPAEPGAAPMGPFYELESSSPAAALSPGASLEHTHRTIHLVGPRAALDAVARDRLGVGLDAIEAALP
ncbi:MAG: hypothetical protein H6719_18555 [Sandaracinaceae bacterium]|nr:hypothetical protein [Sandaracinaceae bacterium]